MDIALEYATRIIGINKGNIVFNGPTNQLTPEKIREIYGSKLSEAKGEPVGDHSEH